MRYLRYYHTLAVVAILALSGSLLSTTSTAHALPLLVDNVLERRDALDPFTPAQTKAPTESAPSAHPNKPPPAVSPDPATTNDPAPAPSPTPRPVPQPTKAPSPPPVVPTQPQQPPSPAPRPKPSTPDPPAQPHAASPSPKSSDSHNAVSPTGTAPMEPNIPSGTVSNAMPSGSAASPDDGSGVPTKVSEKVLIGFGTVGGLFVFVLGALAFCRHRRKKNLAIALLEQTAQFNHNNPYAKISESTLAAKTAMAYGGDGKENLAMTPTKPIGTYNVMAVYTPALADEIEIGLGESVTILQEYDDGWCLAVNNSRNGIKGVIPRHCLEGYHDDMQYQQQQQQQQHYGGGGGPGYYPPNPGFKAMANKRMSSIPPGGWNQAPPPGYNNGSYGEYPPHPSPHFHQGQQQGYYNGGY